MKIFHIYIIPVELINSKYVLTRYVWTKQVNLLLL